MFTVIGIMFIGIGLGYLMRRQVLPWINHAITCLIWLLLFLLGMEVGQNERIIQSLPTLGVEALAIAIVCVLGSCLAAWGLWRYTHSRKEETHER
ncbi:MAG: LysO family transporter [Bacteroides sp.]|nr:LysO family transporter [Bacteroides sp.]